MYSEKFSKFNSVINELNNKNYNVALELLSKIDAEKEEEYLKDNLYESIFFKKREWLKSVEYYYKVLQKRENEISSLNNIGVALFNLGKFNESINFFEKFKLLAPKKIDAYRNLGISYKNIGNYEKAISNYLKALDIEGNNNTIKQFLIETFNFYIPLDTKKNKILIANEEILSINKKLEFNDINNLDLIKKFINKNFKIIDKINIDYKETQLFRRNKTDLNCSRHFKVFNEFKVIPKFCFNCYKIQIDLNNVVDLIKIFLIFNNTFLKKNNIRKCIVETRKNINGNYKGYIFCENLEEAKDVFNLISKRLEDIKLKYKKIKVKHGCTEFYDEYPEYEDINYEGNQIFNYKEEWKKKEDAFEMRFPKINKIDKKIVGPTHNQINLSDILIIKNWLSYANLIGDKSFLKIYDKKLKQNYLDEDLKDQISFRKQG